MLALLSELNISPRTIQKLNEKSFYILILMLSYPHSWHFTHSAFALSALQNFVVAQTHTEIANRENVNLHRNSNSNLNSNSNPNSVYTMIIFSSFPLFAICLHFPFEFLALFRLHFLILFYFYFYSCRLQLLPFSRFLSFRV